MDGTPQKRPKLAGQEVHFYPPVHADDDASYERNLQLLKAETDKVKPSSDVLKELMRRTFPNRWDAYVTRSEPSTLAGYLAALPLLKKATYVSKVIVSIFFLYPCTVILTHLDLGYFGVCSDMQQGKPSGEV